MIAQLIAFATASLVVIVVPGPDLMLVLRNTARAGRTAAAWTAAGILLGLAILGAAAAIGITALLAASTTLYTVVRVAGGLYLIYLGVQALRSWLRTRGLHAHQPATSSLLHQELPPGVRASCFRQGLVSNLLNPKVAAFYVSLFPQFDLAPLAPALEHIMLAAAFWAMCLAWYIALVSLIGRLGNLLQSPKLASRTEAAAGGALIGLGGYVLVRAH
ncbi:LysE family translocator [Streptosporangium sandarakinum]|uniref:LysE family translocator n=1 Tax=Streptosporangium sandarakinum TaxID=1260955 RepID=UPI0033AE4D9C